MSCRELRVLQLLSNPKIGGTETFALGLGEVLRQRGVHSEIINVWTGGALVQEAKRRGLSATEIAGGWRLGPSVVRRLWAILRQKDFDIVCAYGLRVNLLVRLIHICGVRCRIVCCLRGLDTWRKWYHILVDRATQGAVAAFIGNSKVVCEVRRERERTPWGRLYCIPNGIDCAYYAPRKTRLNRAALGLPGGVLCTTVANFRRQKGHAFLLDVLAEDTACLRLAHYLWIGGDGPCKVDVQRRVSELVDRKQIAVHGVRGDIRDVVGASDVFILPSREEGMPRALMEAMALGVPVLATAVGGTSEVVRDGVDGFLVPYGDKATMAQRLRRLLGDADLRRRMGRNGRARILSAFDFSTIGSRYVSLFRKLAPARRNRNDGGSPRVGVVCAISASLDNLLLTQMEAMVRAGYEVFGISSDGPEVEKVRSRGVNVVPVEILRRIQPAHDFQVVRRLTALFRDLRLDIVHTHTPKAAFLAQIAAKLAGVPIRINTLHGLYFYGRPNGLGKWFYKRMEVQTCRMATHVLSQSQEDVDLLVREKLLRPEKIEWQGNGIDVCRFDPGRFSRTDRCAMRLELGIPDDAPVIGIIARMVEEKGLLDLFEAMAEVRRHRPDAWLVHIGFVDTSREGGLTPEAAGRYGIADQAVFCGQRDDVERLLQAMDVYCLPSYREGYPRSVLEANAMALPAVVTDIRGCREAVVDGHNGLLVPAREPRCLAAALLRVLGDEGLRRELGSNARKRAEDVFDERRVVKVVLEVYETQLDRARRAGLLR